MAAPVLMELVAMARPWPWPGTGLKQEAIMSPEPGPHAPRSACRSQPRGNYRSPLIRAGSHPETKPKPKLDTLKMVEESTMKACIEMKSLASLLLQWTGSSVSMGKMAEYTTPSEALRWGMTAGWDAPRAVSFSLAQGRSMGVKAILTYIYIYIYIYAGEHHPINWQPPTSSNIHCDLSSSLCTWSCHHNARSHCCLTSPQSQPALSKNAVCASKKAMSSLCKMRFFTMGFQGYPTFGQTQLAAWSPWLEYTGACVQDFGTAMESAANWLQVLSCLNRLSWIYKAWSLGFQPAETNESREYFRNMLCMYTYIGNLVIMCIHIYIYT